MAGRPAATIRPVLGVRVSGRSHAYNARVVESDLYRRSSSRGFKEAAMPRSTGQFSTIDEAVAAIKRGEVVIVVDAEDPARTKAISSVRPRR